METYYLIYKITCLLNDRFYIGQHATNDITDGYMGSGKIIKRSIKKYGKENHLFEILEYLPDSKSLKIREREIVNDDLIKTPSCMNIQLGGGGGFSSEEHATRARKSAGEKTISTVRDIHLNKLKTDEAYHNKWLNSQRESHLGDKNAFFGKKHSEETIKNMSLSRKGIGCGESNSQYGTCWVSHSEFGIKKIKKDDLILYEKNGWVKGRKKIAG